MPRGHPPIHPKPKDKPAAGRGSAPADTGGKGHGHAGRGNTHPTEPSDTGNPQGPSLGTVGLRQAWVNRVLDRPGGAKKLAYYMKNHGYDMPTMGHEGYKYALHGFITLGTAPDQVTKYNAAWAKRHGPGAASPPGADAGTNPHGDRNNGGGGTDTTVDPIAAAAGASGAAAQGTDYSALMNDLDPTTAKMLDPKAYARTQANLKYNAQIADIVAEQKRQPGQAKQNQKDIKDWYGQIDEQQAQGIISDRTANEAAQANISRLGQALVGAAGGNEAAGGLVGAAATSDAGTLAATGSADLALANRIKELTQLEGATQGINEKRYAQRQAHDTTRELAGLRGEKGATFADSLDKALAFNNAARQTNFGNELGMVQTRIGADAAGTNLATAQVGLDTARVGLAEHMLNYQQMQNQLKSGGRVDWAHLKTDARNNLVQEAVRQALGPGLHPIDTYNRSRKKAYDWAVTFAGINNPAFRAAVDAALWRSNANVWGKKKK